MSNNINKFEFENKEKVSKIIKSICFSILLTLTLLFVYAILLSYTDVPESTMELAIISISSISIFVFSLICMLKIKNNGILNGGIIGLGYMFCIYLISSIVQTGFSVNVNSLIMIIAGILSGIIGGIIGVNIK